MSSYYRRHRAMLRGMNDHNNIYWCVVFISALLVSYSAIKVLRKSDWSTSNDTGWNGTTVCAYKLLFVNYFLLLIAFIIKNTFNLQDLLLIASLHGQYDQNCLASIVVVLLPV